MTIVNKPGGSGTIAHTYVMQRAGDPHTLGIITSALIADQINGLSNISAADFTPIAMLTNDYVVFAVSSASAIKTGKDLADRLKANARSVSVGVPSAFGTSRHIAAGLLIKSLGGNPRDLKPVVFKGSAEAIPAMLGGHLDLVVIGAGNAVSHVEGGRMRVIAVAAPQRLTGALADVPTWKEQGIDVSYGALSSSTNAGVAPGAGLLPASNKPRSVSCYLTPGSVHLHFAGAEGGTTMAEASPAVDTAVGEAYEQHMVPGMFLRWAHVALRYAAPRQGESVLDVACGTGIGARLAAEAVAPSGKVIGLDIDPGVIAVARQVAGNAPTPVEWHAANALGMPFESGTFDLCLCLQGLQFFPDRLAGFAEIRRVLKPSGRLVATIWGPLESNKGHHAVVQALERQNVDAAAAKRACSFADAEDIKQTAGRAGFVDIELHTQDGASEFASIRSFLDGMTKGSPSTRHAVARLSNDQRKQFEDEVREALEPYVIDGTLAYPMRSHILSARLQA